jgi:two-component system cell cycle sensor histidine kinase/response regulator CckA
MNGHAILPWPQVPPFAAGGPCRGDIPLPTVTEDERLRESEESFRQIAENTRDVLVIWDPEAMRMLYVNAAYETVWQRSRASAYAAPWTLVEAVHPEDRERFAALVEGGMRGGYVEGEYRIVRPDGSVRWLRGRTFPLCKASGRIYRITGIAEDVTERNLAKEALVRGQRLASLGTLAAGIAHEINNPVAGILATTEVALAARGTPEGEAIVDEALGRIAAEARRCGRIVRSVLHLARAETIERWPHDLSDIVRRTADLTRGDAADAGATIRLELAEDLPPVLLNPIEIEQVSVNLILNAVQAGSSIIRLRTERSADGVRLAVDDDGRGIPASEASRVFDPFFTTRRSDGGTGLGLSVVHGIVERHGGVVRLDSSPGRGTTVTVDLPIGRDLPPEPEAPVEARAGGPGPAPQYPTSA